MWTTEPMCTLWKACHTRAIALMYRWRPAWMCSWHLLCWKFHILSMGGEQYETNTWVGDFSSGALRFGDFYCTLCTFGNVLHPLFSWSELHNLGWVDFQTVLVAHSSCNLLTITDHMSRYRKFPHHHAAWVETKATQPERLNIVSHNTTNMSWFLRDATLRSWYNWLMFPLAKPVTKFILQWYIYTHTHMHTCTWHSHLTWCLLNGHRDTCQPCSSESHLGSFQTQNSPHFTGIHKL